MDIDKGSSMVAQLKRRPLSRAPEIPLAPIVQPQAEVTVDLKVPTDIPSYAGKPKFIVALGLNSAGKSTLLRAIGDDARTGEGTVIATVARNQTLVRYFPEVLTPDNHKVPTVVAFLEDLIDLLKEEPRNVIVDFPGGDLAFPTLLAAMPNLVADLEAMGMHPVALYPLSTRQEDLGALFDMSALGFRPRATALILNEGRTPDPSLPPRPQFDAVIYHSTFRAALARGAVPIWMPRLWCAQIVEDRQIGFTAAAESEDLSWSQKMKLADWQRRRREEFAVIRSWLP